MNYVLVGNIEAATDSLSYTAYRLAGRTRTHLMLDGNEVYVREDEKERFETFMTKYPDHWAVKVFKREDNNNETILKEKIEAVVCAKYYTRCRKGNCNY